MNTLYKTRKLFLPILFGIFTTVSALAEWEEGGELPDLSAYGLEGSLPGIEGKVTYVDFWASWCAPCKASFPEMERIYLENEDAGFQVLAVSVDSTQKAMQRFLDRAKPSFAIVWDREQKLVADAGIEVMPTSFLVDAKGIIRKVHYGWRGGETAAELEREIAKLLEEKE
ncbi:Redoxin superfamily [Verrucomicrobiia bacterium DG1235]|nr:Redoxin superfamily [Verrucomicrobiae bacterium DG1235]